MSDKKAEFFWAIIGDANPEPVAVTVENGKRVAYTIGCADPFDLDSGNIELMLPEGSFARWNGDKRELYLKDPTPMAVPRKVTNDQRQQERDAAERRINTDRKRGVVHGWRRLNP